MRLLVVTQKVDRDDAILGFFHRWLIEFGKHWEYVHVICLEEGYHELPENISVFSLGKESGRSRGEYMVRFFKYIFVHRSDYDAVFVHMNPIYIVLAGVLWRLWSKRTGLWYVHRSVDLKLRVACLFVDEIFSAAKESFRLKSKKLRILGHGIDINQFICSPKRLGSPLEILTVGRITKIKNCDLMLKTAQLLKNKYKLFFQLTFVGAPVSKEDGLFFKKLQQLSDEYNLTDRVIFKGAVSHHKIQRYYCNADMVLNVVPTGGLDKTVIEAMAAGRLTLSTNKGFATYFVPYDSMLIPREGDPEDLAEKIMNVLAYNNRDAVTTHLHKTAAKHFSVEELVKTLSNHLKMQST